MRRPDSPQIKHHELPTPELCAMTVMALVAADAATMTMTGEGLADEAQAQGLFPAAPLPAAHADAIKQADRMSRPRCVVQTEDQLHSWLDA
jgi:hypothetical protein